jgi:transcription elongation factor SPT6
MNCVAFLKIKREAKDDEEYDILDSMRIHSEDYHIARKMAADAEDMDEEDIEMLPHPSDSVVQLLERDNAGKLDELSLDDFAAALLQTQQIRKRLTLYMIRDELQRPYAERRPDFRIPSSEEKFAMLTGETSKTLELGFIVPIVVVRVLDKGGLLCRLDSGVMASVDQGYKDLDAEYRAGQTVRGQVIAIDHEELKVELSLLKQSVDVDDSQRRQFRPDKYYDLTQANMDKQAYEAKSKKKEGRQRRVVQHPNFHNMNAGQAEQYLANLQRGDCVIRPSSRGVDHLAVTWKVDDGVYQHIGKPDRLHDMPASLTRCCLQMSWS